MQKHAIPTTVEESLLRPSIATLIREGIRPPIPAPLPMVPIYSGGNIPNTAVALPITDVGQIIRRIFLV